MSLSKEPIRRTDAEAFVSLEAELRATKDALRESNERITDILGSVTDAFYALDENLRFTYINNRGAEVCVQLQKSPADLIGRCAWDEFPELVGTQIETACRVALRDQVPQFFEYDFASVSTWFDVRIFPLRRGVSIYLQDITERKRTQHAARERDEALRENEERLRATFSQAAVGIAITELDGTILETNEKLREILGCSPKDLDGLRFEELTHEADVALLRERLPRLLAGEIASCAVENRYQRKDGSYVWALATVSVLRDITGKPRRFIGVIEDISSRRATQEQLLEETRMLEILNEMGPTLASKLDLGELVQGITDAATALTGAKFGAFFYNGIDGGADALMLYALAGAPRAAFEKFGNPRATALFGPTFRGGPPIRSDDILEDPRYGTMSPHHGMPPGHLPVRSYLAVSVISRSGEVIGGLFFGHPEPGAFTQRSERLAASLAAQAAVGIDNARLYERLRRAAGERERLLQAEGLARAEAERASLMKDEFLATISHELRTPLNAILGWSQILLAGGGKGGITRGIEVIARNARAQAKLIEDLLDMSRIISGKVRLEMQLVDIHGIIEAAIESVRPSAVAKHIRVSFVPSPAADLLAGDPNRLQQVVWNLLTNGVKFTPKGGSVTVRVLQREDFVEVAVSDTGRGIAPAFLPLVFDRFRQADASSTRAQGGLGLGLSIVKHLVELHGGQVEAKSDGDGRGATFVVTLSSARRRDPSDDYSSRESVRAMVAAVVPRNDLEGLRILAIDDEDDARELLQEVLERYKAEVIAVGSVTEGLAALDRARPDVVVSDVGMPERDGYEFMRQLRTRPLDRGGAIPAIALTAFARNEDRLCALNAGFQTHLAKPVEPNELVAAIRDVVGRPRTP